MILIISIIINPLLHIENIFIYSTLLSLIFLYKKEHYYIISLFTGLVYDILYSNIFINTILYLFIAYIIKYIFSYKKYNLLNIIITSMFIIFIYNLINCFILYYIYNINVSILYLVKNIIYIYIFNILYILLIFFILNKKHKLTKTY